MEQTLHFELASGASPAFARIVIAGPITLNKMFPLQTTLRSQTAEVLVLDFQQVPYIDSAGLGAVVNAHVSAERRGGKLLLSGVNERVRSLLELTKVVSVLNLDDSASL